MDSKACSLLALSGRGGRLRDPNRWRGRYFRVGPTSIASRIRLWLVSVLALVGCAPVPDSDIELGSFDYATVQWPYCEASGRYGMAGASDMDTGPGGLGVSIRTPANYDRSVQHPLIVVYAPAGHHRFASESMVGMTREATAAGFVVAYVDSRRLSLQTIKELHGVPSMVAERWCVNLARVYMTGHSDGGTVSAAAAFLPDVSDRPRAVAPSAAGIRAADMQETKCPAPVSVMTLQNSGDELFPNFGAELAAWWAACNACSPEAVALDDGCSRYAGCAEGVETIFCERPGSHRVWPDRNAAIIAFFTRT